MLNSNHGREWHLIVQKLRKWFDLVATLLRDFGFKRIFVAGLSANKRSGLPCVPWYTRCTLEEMAICNRFLEPMGAAEEAMLTKHLTTGQWNIRFTYM